MYAKKKASNQLEEDYTKIKPGYIPKTQTVPAERQEGFVNIITQEKKESREKALDAQKLYKQALDHQLKSKFDSRANGFEDPLARKEIAPRRVSQDDEYELNQQTPEENENFSPGKGITHNKIAIKNKNLTESEFERLEKQKRRQAEMKEILDLQVAQKQKHKEAEKAFKEEQARQIRIDAEYNKEQGGTNAKSMASSQKYKKTALW